MIGARRRLSLLVASGLATLFCVQLFWTHAKLEGVHYLSESGAGLRSPHEGALWADPAIRWAGRKPQAEALDQQQQQLERRGMDSPAVIVFCYNRVSYLNQTLHSLASLEGLGRYTVYVSQVGAK
jgi:hypothetical protein